MHGGPYHGGWILEDWISWLAKGCVSPCILSEDPFLILEISHWFIHISALSYVVKWLYLTCHFLHSRLIYMKCSSVLMRWSLLLLSNDEWWLVRSLRILPFFNACCWIIEDWFVVIVYFLGFYLALEKTMRFVSVLLSFLLMVSTVQSSSEIMLIRIILWL